ncbi:MAG: zf-HC2 domain-containing protein [Candidatus Sericytochromatia bacterium]|nr:zf-HC2 domain-containing protein [Candidatus Sericytochromatia bacterium]
MFESCGEVREALSDHVDGRLPPATGAALEAHLAACEGCRAEAGGMRELVGLLGRLAPVAMPTDLGARVAAALAREPGDDAEPIGCDEAEDYLTGHLEGGLEAWEAGAVTAHLAACPACRNLSAELAATVALLRACPRPAPPASLVSRVARALAEADRPGAAPTPLAVRVPVVAAGRRWAWSHLASAVGGAAVACAALLVWTWLPGVGVPTIETAAVSVRQDVAVNIAFDLDERVDGVVFQVDLPEGLQFIDESSQPMLAQSVSWRGSLEKGRTVVPIVVRGVRPGRYAIEAYVRKGPLKRRTTVLLPVEG